MAKPLILKDFQIQHYRDCLRILLDNFSYYDTSKTGTGKTIIASRLSLDLQLPIFVVCPANVVDTWARMVRDYGINIIEIISYDKLVGKGQTKHNYLYRTEETEMRGNTSDKKNSKYVPTDIMKQIINNGILYIIDEAHNIKNDSLGIKACYAISQEIVKSQGRSRIGILSASMLTKPTNVINLLLAGGIINKYKLYDVIGFGELDLRSYGFQYFYNYCYSINPTLTRSLAPVSFDYTNYRSSLIKNYIISLYKHIVMPRVMRGMKEISLPYERDVKICYYNTTPRETEMIREGEVYLSDAAKIFAMNEGRNMTTAFGYMQHAIKLLENGKIPIIFRKSKDVLRENPNAKIIIYLWHIDQMKAMKNMFTNAGFEAELLYGETKKADKTLIINKFQEPNNNLQILISNPRVGGVGIDLDDQDGNHPRHMFIIPHYYFIYIYQSLGRIYRANTKSKATIRFVYSRNFLQEIRILDALAKTSKNLRELTNANDIKLPGEYDKYYEDDSGRCVPLTVEMNNEINSYSTQIGEAVGAQLEQEFVQDVRQNEENLDEELFAGILDKDNEESRASTAVTNDGIDAGLQGPIIPNIRPPTLPVTYGYRTIPLTVPRL